MKKRRRRKKNREPLTPERILDAAALCIERDGLPGLSMRGLGAELGVEAMSLYHHFPSKQHLCDALLDRLIAPLTGPNPALPLREAMRASMHAYRAAVRAQPAFAPFAVTHRMNTAVCLAYLESMIAPLLAAGLTPEHAARAFRAACYYVVGAVLDETSGYARGPTAADALSLEQQREIAPSVIQLGPYFGESHWDRTFELGLEAVLDLFENSPDT